jgi:hypothetical protein
MPRPSSDLIRTDTQQKRAYFATLTNTKLIGLLLIATVRHPELPIYPSNVQKLIPTIPGLSTQPPPPPMPVPQRFPQPQYQHPSAFQHQSLTPNGHTPTGQTPHSHNFSSHSEMDHSEAQLIGESRDQPPAQSMTMDLAGHQYEEDDGYDTDPPAHYPKPGHGLARTLRPESEELNWLVDDNFEVFSHGWKGDGSGVGADGTLDGMGSGQKVV